jgi:hypothetical protein
MVCLEWDNVRSRLGSLSHTNSERVFMEQHGIILITQLNTLVSCYLGVSAGVLTVSQVDLWGL